MKNVFRSISFFLMLTLFLFSCGNETNQNNSGAGEGGSSTTEEAQTFTMIPGQVRSMTTKLPMANVSVISSSNPSFITTIDGQFFLKVVPGVQTTASFSKTGYQALAQEYENTEFVESIIVYMEDSTTVDAASKTTLGFTLKTDGKKNEIPIDSVRVIETVSKDSVFTDSMGAYTLSFDEKNPIYQYDFKLIGGVLVQTLIIKNTSNIKDSTRLDVVFTGTATGIDIEPMDGQ